MQIKSSELKERYDYIIVGAGIVGITILCELLKIGKKNILIVESGSMLGSNPYSKNKIKSEKFPIKIKSIFSGVGGGSNVWGSLNGIFDKTLIDKFYNLKKFPIKYSDYLDYLKKTKEYGFPDISEFKTDEANNDKLKVKKFVQVTPNIRFFHFSSILENKKVDFIQNCYADNIIKTKNKEKKITFNCNNKMISSIGEKIILCANTIENYKLLRKSNLNVDYKLLGTGFMNHPKGVIGSLKFKKEFSKYMPIAFKNRITYLGIQLKGSNYNHYLNLNKGFKIPFLHYLSQKIYGNIELYQGNFSSTSRSFFRNYFLLISYYLIRIIEVIIEKSKKNHIYLELYSEMKFNNKNVINFDKKNNQTSINYELSKDEINAAKNLIKMFEQKFKCKIKYKPKSEAKLKKLISIDASHHMGGIICGDIKNKSILNMDLSLKLEKDIFVCGGAIFPFSGIANPTMSYVALAIWLSENHL